MSDKALEVLGYIIVALFLEPVMSAGLRLVAVGLKRLNDAQLKRQR